MFFHIFVLHVSGLLKGVGEDHNSVREKRGLGRKEPEADQVERDVGREDDQREEQAQTVQPEAERRERTAGWVQGGDHPRRILRSEEVAIFSQAAFGDVPGMSVSTKTKTLSLLSSSAKRPEPRRSGHDYFNSRIVTPRLTWGKGFPYFITVIEDSANVRRLLVEDKHCLSVAVVTSTKSKFKYETFDCPFPADEAMENFTKTQKRPWFRFWFSGAIRIVLIPECSGHYDDKAANFCCRYDKTADYILNAAGSEYSKIKWFAIGDDDIAYSPANLLPFLSHYDHREKLVLNPQSTSLEDQRAHKGFLSDWKPPVNECNPNLPHVFQGSVMSQGLLAACNRDFAAGAMQEICTNFGGAQDINLPVLFWKEAAKFIPMGAWYSEPGKTSFKDAEGRMMMHKARAFADHDYMARAVRHDQSFQAAEELPGPRYAESLHAKGGLPAGELTIANCKRAADLGQTNQLEVVGNETGAECRGQ